MKVMVDPAAGFAGVASRDSPNDFIVRNFDGNHGIDVLNPVQGFGLWNGAWEPIKHHALCCIRLGQTLLDNPYNDVIWDKRPRFHVALCLNANLGSSGHGCPQHVSSGDLRLAGPVHDALRLRALARSRGTKEDDAAHGRGWAGSLSTSRSGSTVLNEPLLAVVLPLLHGPTFR